MADQGATKRPMRALTPATLRGVTRVNQATGRIGVSVDTEDGRVIRFTLDAANAQALAEMLSWALDAYHGSRSHSDESSGMPSVERPTPVESERV